MAQIAGVVGLVVALGLIIVGVLRWRARGTTEIGRLASDFCAFLDNVVAQDGYVALDQYTTDARTLAMSELQHLTRRAHDRKLRRHLNRALDAFDHSLALAKPHVADFAKLDDPDASPLPQPQLQDEQREHQVESADISRAAFGDALARVRRLDRWVKRSR